MANTPIVSDSNNGSYNGLLSTANGFYRAEAWNLGIASTTKLAVSTPRYINTTFANAGDCQGIVLGCQAQSVVTNAYGVQVRLEQYATVTMTIASPCVVTWTGHGFAGGEEISFTTTGALPTGLTAGTVYFVKFINANTFNVSATSGGANINTSGSQSGVHSCGVRRAFKELSAAEINPEYILGSAMGTSGNNYVNCITPFKFVTPYTITTAATTWRFRIADGISTGATTIWNLNTSDATNISYVTWCNTQVTATNADILIIVDKITIDSSFTTGAAVGTGEATLGVAGWICRSSTISAANIALLEWDDTPASSFTFTISGYIFVGSWSGFRVGTSSNRIPNAQKAIITRPATAAAGSSNACGFSHVQGISSNTAQVRLKAALFLYGQIPTNPYGILASDAATGQPSFTTTVDLSADWAASDEVFIGKQDVKGQGTNVWQTISSIVGTTVTLTGNLLTNTRKSGGTVINRNRGYGINILNASATQTLRFYFDHPCHLNISGVRSNAEFQFAIGFSSVYDFPALPANRSQFVIEDNLFERSSESYFFATSLFFIPSEGISYKRNINFQFKGIQGLLALYTTSVVGIPMFSGICEYKNNRHFATTFSSMLSGGGTNIKFECEDNVWNNGIATTINATWINLCGTYLTFKRNKIYGSGLTAVLGGAVVINTCINADFEDNEYDNNTCALTLGSQAFILGMFARNELFGIAQNNTSDIGMITAGYYDIEFTNPTDSFTLDPTSVLTTGIPGSKLKITDNNSVTNDDSVISPFGYFKRCGDGLSDTTVHTSGSDKFSLRFEPITSTDLLEWRQTVPTGNIQGLNMAVSIWVKINSATYYAGTNRKPRLNVNYDNGTVAYTEASSSTSWQLLTVAFSPSTTYGQIVVYIDGYTDATGSNAYFYIDDMSIFFPPGVQLALGGLDLWANALPIVPSISTNVNASDVWNIPTSTLTSPGSTGEALINAADESITAEAVWTYDGSGIGRTLTSFGSLVSDITAAVWSAGTRTLTSFGTLVTDIWASATRTLTGIGSSGIASETNATTNTSNIITEINSNEAKIDIIDTNVDSILSVVNNLPNEDDIALAVWEFDQTGLGRSLTEYSDLVDDIWDESLSGHLTPGTTGAALDNADSINDLDDIAEAVWTYDGTGIGRTLTDFGTLIADIWSYGTRTLTSFGTLVSDISTAVWSAGTRTLTSFGSLASDVWAVATRTLTGIGSSGIASEANATTNTTNIVVEIDANESKIDIIDTNVDSILVDTNEIQTKLPNNNIMGSSVKTDKDDEIDAIKAKTDNLPSDPTSETNATTNKNSIITEINANETKIDSIITSLSSLSSDIETILALVHENSEVTNQTYDSNNNLLTADIKHYASATDLENHTSAIRVFELTASYTANKLTAFQIKRTL